jgi:twitching motility protein PilT
MDPKERRTHGRRKIRLPLMCWRLENGKPVGDCLEIATKDVSLSGLSFESKTIHPIGHEFLAQIHLPDHNIPLATPLKVVRIETILGKDGYLIGTAFLDLKDDEKTAIASSLDNLNLYSLLETALASGASDIHLTVGKPPMIRAHGRISRLSGETVQDGQIKAMLYPLLTAAQIENFEKNKELDFAFSPNVNARFRVNMHLQKGFLEAAFRSVPSRTKSLERLGLPEATMDSLCREPSGLILISGATGSGKTTTLAAMVSHMNETMERIIITVEDPIEYIHTSQKSIVKQRELGSDTLSYAEALKRTLRQDPDVVCVGEILDKDTLSAAMRAAETGHLVISTIHAPDTVQTIERIVNLFPPEHSASVCQQLSSCLLGIVFQVLLPGREAGRRVLGTEILVSNPAVRNLIREGRFSQIRTAIQTGRALGMYTLAARLRELYEASLIDADVMQQHSKGG